MVAVGNCNLDFRKSIQNIKFSHGDITVIVDHVCISNDNEIKPPTSSLSASCDPEFLANFLKFFPILIKQLGWKSTITNSCRIRLHDSIHCADFIGRDPKTSTHAPNRTAGRSHIGIGTKINIQHGGIGTLDQDLFRTFGQDTIKIEHRVCDIRSYFWPDVFIIIQFLFNVHHKRLVPFLVIIYSNFQFCLKGAPVAQQITNSKSSAFHFGRISRPDPLLGGSQTSLPLFLLLNPIDFLVERKHQMGSVRYKQTIFKILQTLLGILFQLFKKRWDIYDHSTSNNRSALIMNKPTGKQVEVITGFPNHNRVSGIVSSSTTTHNISFLSENINQLAFPFISPLGSEHN
eukprot:Sdes_comp9829_c0_seq1m1368